MTFVQKILLTTTAALTMTSAAIAQDAAPAPAPDAGAAAAPSSFSDDDIQKFASAAVELNTVPTDAPAPERQTQMAAIVQKNGLEPAKFNAIAQASQGDPALMQKIQKAAAASQPQSSAPPASGSAAPPPAPGQ